MKARLFRLPSPLHGSSGERPILWLAFMSFLVFTFLAVLMTWVLTTAMNRSALRNEATHVREDVAIDWRSNSPNEI